MLRRRKAIRLIAVLIMAFSRQAWGDDMTKADKAREKSLIAKLEAGEIGGVKEVDGDLHVMWVNTDEHFKLASQLERMTRLYAAFAAGAPLLSGPELRHLRGHKNLREVNIHLMPVPGTEYAVFPTLPRLQKLGCSPVKGAKEALIYIGKCKALRTLLLSYGEISDECLDPLSELTSLKELDFLGNPVSSGVRVVRQMKNLRELGLTDTQVTDDVLTELARLPNLEQLFVGSPNVTNAGIAALAKSPKLSTLGVTAPKVTATGVACLAEIRHLRYLDVSVNLTDANVVDALSKMTQFKSLRCEGKGISEKSRKQIAKLLPKCEIHWVKPPGEVDIRSLLSDDLDDE